MSKQDWGTYPSFSILSTLLCGPPGQQSPQLCKLFFLFWLIIIRTGHLAESKWSVCIIIIIIIIHSLELFTPALADGFSLESEWQQASSSLQATSQYSGRSQ